MAGLRCFFFCFRVDWHWGGEEETDEMKGRKSDRIQGSGRGERQVGTGSETGSERREFSAREQRDSRSYL